MIILNHNRRVHFIGIGGVGMSGLGELLLSLGFTVTGSDRQSSSITARLETLGIRIRYDHIPALVRKGRIAEATVEAIDVSITIVRHHLIVRIPSYPTLRRNAF